MSHSGSITVVTIFVLLLPQLQGCHGGRQWTKPPSPPVAAALETPRLQEELVQRMVLANIARYLTDTGTCPVPWHVDLETVEAGSFGSKRWTVRRVLPLAEDERKDLVDLDAIYKKVSGIDSNPPTSQEEALGIKTGWFSSGRHDEIPDQAVIAGHYEETYVWVMPEQVSDLELLSRTIETRIFSSRLRGGKLKPCNANTN